MTTHLQQLISSEDALGAFRDFDRLMADTQSRLPARSTATESAEIVWMLYELMRDHNYMSRVIGLKLREIGRAILTSIDSQNLTAQIMLTRSLVEHVASLAYQEKLLATAVSDVPRQSGTHKIFVATERHRTKLSHLYYGSGTEAATGKKFVHVNDMIKALEAKITGISDTYDNLCDFVHPNFGSNKLVSSGTLGTGNLFASATVFEAELAEANRVTEALSAEVFELQLSMAGHLTELNLRMNIASQPGAQVTKIFSDRKNSSGSGSSKDDPLQFPAARTHTEAMKSRNSYLAQRGMELLSRQTVSIDDDGLIEKLETSKGVLWVKYKLQTL